MLSGENWRLKGNKIVIESSTHKGEWHVSDGRVSNVRVGHAGGINFQPFLPCARSAWAIQGITRRSSSSSQHRKCLESLARTPRNYTSEWKCGVVGGPGCSGWEVRWVRGWAGWLTFHNARFYAHHAAPRRICQSSERRDKIIIEKKYLAKKSGRHDDFMTCCEMDDGFVIELENSN
jgi:hypothetical protein